MIYGYVQKDVVRTSEDDLNTFWNSQKYFYALVIKLYQKDFH